MCVIGKATRLFPCSGYYLKAKAGDRKGAGKIFNKGAAAFVLNLRDGGDGEVYGNPFGFPRLKCRRSGLRVLRLRF